MIKVIKECVFKKSLKYIQLTEAFWKDLLHDNKSYKIDLDYPILIRAIVFKDEYYVNRTNTKVTQTKKIFQLYSNKNNYEANINDYLVFDDDYIRICNEKQFKNNFEETIKE